MKMRDNLKTQTQQIMEKAFQIGHSNPTSAIFSAVTLAGDLELPKPSVRRCIANLVKAKFIGTTSTTGVYSSPTEEQMSDFLKWKFAKGRKGRVTQKVIVKA